MPPTAKDSGSTETAGQNLPDYEISAEVVDRVVRLSYHGVVVAESSRAVLYQESRLPPVYYFPREDVRTDLLRRTRHRTHCPFKGNASYWTLGVGDQNVENSVWSYENPLEEAVGIKGRLAFWIDKLGITYDEDGDFDSQRTVMDSHGSVYVDWLLRHGWDTKTPSDLTEQLGRMLVDCGVPLARLSVFLRTLHPLLIGSACVASG